jgi:hypothetical protein
MVEKQIDVENLAVDFNRNLAPHKKNAGQFQKEPSQSSLCSVPL